MIRAGGALALILVACGNGGPTPVADAPPAPGDPDAEVPLADAAPPPPPDAEPGPPDDFSTVTAEWFWESESHLAVDPTGQHVVASWIAIPAGPFTTAMGYSFSHDGGTTWTAPEEVFGSAGRTASDPVVAFDAAGRAYLAFISFVRDSLGGPSDMHLEVAVAEPGASAFAAPVDVSGSAMLDKPWIVVDGDGRVMIIWTRFETLGMTIAVSEDQGATWTVEDLENVGHFGTLCAGREPGSPAYAIFPNLMSTWNNMDLHVYRTDDGGATWDFISHAAEFEMAGPPTPACAVVGDDVYVTYLRGIAKTSFDTVRVVHSSDRGETWTAPVTINQGSDVVGWPQMAAGPSGRVEVAWLAGVVNEPATLVHAWTSDGTTWGFEDVPAVVGPFSYRRDTFPWLGDYFGLAVGPEWIYLLHPRGDMVDQRVHTELVRRTAP